MIKLKNNRGFTVIELMVIIAVGGILSSIGVWSLARYLPVYRLNAAGRQIVSHLRLTRQKAITTQSYYCFYGERTGDDTYDIFEDNNRDWSPDADYSHITMADGIALQQTAGLTPFFFTPTGSVVNTGGGTENAGFRVSNTRDDTVNIHIRASGFIDYE